MNSPDTNVSPLHFDIVTSIVTTSPVIEGVEDGVRVEGVNDGTNVGREDGADVMNKNCISTLHSLPMTSSKFSIDEFTSGTFVASTTRLTSAYTPYSGYKYISI